MDSKEINCEEKKSEINDLDSIFFALSDRKRRLILSFLLCEEMNITQISRKCAISMASTSKHIQVLLKAKLVTQKPKGRNRICRVSLRNLSKANVWLSSFGLLDLLDLSNLEEFLSKENLI